MNKIHILLISIVILAAFLRIYKLDTIPPGLNWDEVDAGYNAYSIANFGRDEWGQIMPLVFTSFRDDKHPVHIYAAVPFVKLFGLSDFTTRLPSALVGILSVFIVYLLSYSLFKSYLTAILSALFLSISPYHLQFSRGLWESNFALFFFLLGLMLFYRSLKNNGKLLNLSFLSFGVSLFAYHSSKIVVPPIVFILILLYFKDLKKLSINFYSALGIFLIFILVLILNPKLMGLARIEQTRIGQDEIEKTQAFKKTGSLLFGQGEIVFKGLLTHFTPEYLFIKGDQGPRNSVKVFGEFYKTDALLIIAGIISLLILRSKVTIILLTWLLISPLPASLVGGAPNANRALFMLGIWNLITAFGASNLIKLFKGKIRVAVLIIILFLIDIQVLTFTNYYFNVYPKKDAIDWQYGMKQIVEFVKYHPQYSQVFMTDIRSQPYIFFLFYLKTPLPEYLNSVVYNRSESKSFSTVSYFDKYFFEGWNPIESLPSKGVLYVVSPSEYDGLRHKKEFDIKKIIYYPNGTDAFFIVSAK